METPVPQAAQAGMITVEELFRQKGEIVTQMEIAQQRLQMINGQLQQLFNQQAQVAGPQAPQQR